MKRNFKILSICDRSLMKFRSDIIKWTVYTYLERIDEGPVTAFQVEID